MLDVPIMSPGTGPIAELMFTADCDRPQFVPNPSSVMSCIESIVASNCTHMMDVGLRCVLESNAGGGVDGIDHSSH